MVLMAVLAYYFFAFSPRGNSIIPTLGVVALASQRVLPILQQLYSSWSDLLAQRASLLMALELLEQEIPSPPPSGETLAFDNSIVLQRVGFQYAANERHVIRDLDLLIRKGERVAIIGPTGGGKSTVLDILMAIIHPTSGSLMIDGVAVDADNAGLWHARIAHVPQNIFLADKTIAENIAFGQHAGHIDMARVENVAKQVKLSDAIAQIPGGYASRVGERGIQLSGGQRQRIAIARALYRKADVIVLDEATSALDDQTEMSIMETMRNVEASVTIIMVTHREKALQGFDSIYFLKDASLSKIIPSPC
jgi:ATP-binding cassette subfamily B protein